MFVGKAALHRFCKACTLLKACSFLKFSATIEKDGLLVSIHPAIRVENGCHMGVGGHSEATCQLKESSD